MSNTADDTVQIIVEGDEKMVSGFIRGLFIGSRTPEWPVFHGERGIESETFVFKKGTGCKRCNDTGYKGRVALYEVLEMDDDMRDLVLQGASTAELKEQAIRSGMDTIRRAGLNKLIEGVTTVDEVLRVSGAD